MLRRRYREQRIVVGIPAYRAEATIAEVVQTLPAFVDTIIVVDDASPEASTVCTLIASSFRAAIAQPAVKHALLQRHSGTQASP